MTTPLQPEETPARTGSEQSTGPALTPAPGSSDPTLSFDLPGLDDPTELSGSFGRYEILRRLGKGGMGKVYLARDSQLDRLVAIKVPQLEGSDRNLMRERFYREARAAANLHHPNICSVYDVGAIGDTLYLSMAYIEGQTLHDWSRTSRPVAHIVEMVRKIALALADAHAAGIIHRDLKPTNVLVDRRGEPVVMDFGLARRIHLAEEARLTSPGLIMGTPAYMPPEYVQGQDASGAAGDIYSLGVILYELLAGRPPFTGAPLVVLAQIAVDTVPPPSHFRPKLDAHLEAVCLTALARDPAKRHANMKTFAEALAALQGGNDSTLSAQGQGQAERTPAGPSLPQPIAAAALPQVDASLAPRILDLLRGWGWARAIQKIRNRAQRADSEGTRRTYQGFLDWMTGERTEAAHAVEALQALPLGKALRGWALMGQASHQMRERDYNGANKLLEKASSQGDPDDRMLQAAIAHTRASVLVHVGQKDAALPYLHLALDLFGRKHFMTGRVLDTLGMAYAYKGNFPIAREFFEQSIRFKRDCDDEAGIAISHGQLGRLYLEWGHLDQAEHHFQEDLRLAQKLRSRWSEAQIYNHLGQVALARAEREMNAGKKVAGRRQLGVAAGWLDQCIQQCQEGKFAVSEGFARKDRALVYIHDGDLQSAEEQVRLALELFGTHGFAEGQAKTHMVEGIILRQKRRWQDAERKFRQALGHFEMTQEADHAVRAYWEIARTQRDSEAAAPLVTRAYLEALRRAEAARHDPLVRAIEEDLHEVDVEAYLRHLYRRARGADLDEDRASLVEGTSEIGTVLAIDLPGFSEFSHGMDAEAVLVTYNHLVADFTDVLEVHQARVLAYRGNGLLALTTESKHAERGVRAALDLVSALEEFNRPRQLLGLPIFHIRIGVSSGDVLLGNVGTYHKMDFTVLGTTVNLASALRNEAQPGKPSISRSTWTLVRDRFCFGSAEPRQITLSGHGPVESWEVLHGG